MFATKIFRKEEFICDYDGELISTKRMYFLSVVTVVDIAVAYYNEVPYEANFLIILGENNLSDSIFVFSSASDFHEQINE